jgi:hypothetical protein
MIKMKNTSRKIKITYDDLMNITAMSIETITGIRAGSSSAKMSWAYSGELSSTGEHLHPSSAYQLKTWTGIWTGCVNWPEYRLTDRQGGQCQITYNYL